MKLSIIIPVYNVEAYLAKCLDSVIYPDIEDYEIIIVNDGATDSSPAVAESYRARYPKLITVINKPNGGLGSARNAGIEAARGEYLMFLDSDDYLTENAVPEMLDTVSSGADMYIYDFVAVNEDGHEFKFFCGCEKEGHLTLESFPDLLYVTPNAVNKLCRRSLFIDSGVRFPDRVWYEDLRTMPKLYLHTDSIVSLRRTWYKYLQRSGSIINSSKLERNLEIIPAVDEIEDYFRAAGQYDKYSNELEFLTFYHQYLTSSTRVAASDTKSPVLAQLRDNFLKKHPNFKENPLIKAMPKKWRLLSELIYTRHYGIVRLIMKLNDTVKRK